MEQDVIKQPENQEIMPTDELKRLTDFFEILIQIDQRERRQKNGNISEKAATAS